MHSGDGDAVSAAGVATKQRERHELERQLVVVVVVGVNTRHYCWSNNWISVDHGDCWMLKWRVGRRKNEQAGTGYRRVRQYMHAHLWVLQKGLQ